MMRLLTILALIPLVFYDIATSIGGGFAVFNISNIGSTNTIITVFPIALGIGAIALNFWTKQIWSEGNILSLIWILFLLFDVYTTFLGVVGFMSGNGLWAFPHSSIGEALNSLSVEKLLFAIVASGVVVVSPMSCNLIYHQGTRR